MDESLNENNAAGASSGLNAGLGTPLFEELDVKRLRDDVDFLWSLLDDIDTASDIAKADNNLYRAMVEVMQKRRHERVTSDGCSLFVVPNASSTTYSSDKPALTAGDGSHASPVE